MPVKKRVPANAVIALCCFVLSGLIGFILTAALLSPTLSDEKLLWQGPEQQLHQLRDVQRIPPGPVAFSDFTNFEFGALPSQTLWDVSLEFGMGSGESASFYKEFWHDRYRFPRYFPTFVITRDAFPGYCYTGVIKPNGKFYLGASFEYSPL
jgi:hypothetical protein